MYKYTLLSYLMALCAAMVAGQVSKNGARIRMDDGRVISKALQRSHPCTFSSGGDTTCPVKSGETARFNFAIIVNGGAHKLAITRLLITLQLGDSNIVTRARILRLPDGRLVIGSAYTKGSDCKLADGEYSVAPFNIKVPHVTEQKVLDLKIVAAVVDWSDGTPDRDWLLGKIAVQVNPY